MSAYRSMGDVLAMQYGGSQAHHKAEVARDGGVGPSGAVARVVNRVASGGAKLLTSARRFYSNATRTRTSRRVSTCSWVTTRRPADGMRTIRASTRAPVRAVDVLAKGGGADRVAAMVGAGRRRRVRRDGLRLEFDVGSTAPLRGEGRASPAESVTRRGPNGRRRRRRRRGLPSSRIRKEEIGKEELWKARSFASERSVRLYERHVAREPATATAETRDTYRAMCDVATRAADVANSRARYEPVLWNAADAIEAYGGPGSARERQFKSLCPIDGGE